MTKVITYGTYDLLHRGHIRLLERAKALGDYLIVGVTAEDFDKARGKINVHQSLMERIEAVRATGIADEIIVEEYEGQKIDDIRRYGVDIFTVGSDWKGKFDYLSEYCRVVYLDRTEGVSSSQLRATMNTLRLGLVGESPILAKVERESRYVNGLEIAGIYTKDPSSPQVECTSMMPDYETLLERCDAVFIISHPEKHFEQIRQALLKKKHVLCESPVALRRSECEALFQLAEEQGCILMESIKTAYSMAYSRLLLLAKSGVIGKIRSVDAVCTSLEEFKKNPSVMRHRWNSISAWGPTVLLPIFQLLGTDYSRCSLISHLLDRESRFDAFTKFDFVYPEAVASAKVGNGVKSEGELIISGEKGYIIVPAPWWKTDYFEVRFENSQQNRRYFYQLDGEGIRYELVMFLRSVETGTNQSYIDQELTNSICAIMERFWFGQSIMEI